MKCFFYLGKKRDEGCERIIKNKSFLLLEFVNPRPADGWAGGGWAVAGPGQAGLQTGVEIKIEQSGPASQSVSQAWSYSDRPGHPIRIIRPFWED